MYCYYTKQERDCNGTCYTGCPYGYEIAKGTESALNYKCPNCHGKFRHPAVKQGLTKEGATISSGKITYICPFCALEMKGL